MDSKWKWITVRKYTSYNYLLQDTIISFYWKMEWPTMTLSPSIYFLITSKKHFN